MTCVIWAAVGLLDRCDFVNSQTARSWTDLSGESGSLTRVGVHDRRKKRQAAKWIPRRITTRLRPSRRHSVGRFETAHRPPHPRTIFPKDRLRMCSRRCLEYRSRRCLDHFDAEHFGIIGDRKYFGIIAKAWKDIPITEGAIIAVASKIGSRDGQEFSRARWVAVAFEPANEANRKAAVPYLAQQAAAPTTKQSRKTSPTKPVSSKPLIEPRKPHSDGTVRIVGELKMWHKVTLASQRQATSTWSTFLTAERLHST